MKKGEYRYYKSPDYPNMILTLWWESILVKALSNCIKPKHIFYKMVGHGPMGVKYKEAPLVFKEYSRNAKGVDLANNLVSTWRNIHRTSKWWHTIFNHYLTVSLNNAYIIYKYNKLRDKKVTMKTSLKMTKRDLFRKQFMFTVIRKLLYSNGLPNIRDIDFIISSNYKLWARNLYNEPAKVLMHIPEIVPGYEIFNISYNKTFNKDRLDCNLCKKRTIFCCKDCNNGFTNILLCLECFENYHKKLFLRKRRCWNPNWKKKVRLKIATCISFQYITISSNNSKSYIYSNLISDINVKQEL